MAMRVEKYTSLNTPSVASHIEFPDAARHPAVTPHEHDAGVALATLAEFVKPAAKVKTEPQTPRDATLQPTFPELVHAMVTETVETHPDLIEWIHDGEAFVVHDPVREYFVLENELICCHTLTRCPYLYCIDRRVAGWQNSWRSIFAVRKTLESMFCLYHHSISHTIVPLCYRRPQVLIASETAQHVWLEEAFKGKVSYNLVHVISRGVASV